MDLGIIAAVVMLLVWTVSVVMFDTPGWMHLLLTVGVFLVILRIVQRGTARRTP